MCAPSLVPYKDHMQRDGPSVSDLHYLSKCVDSQLLWAYNSNGLSDLSPRSLVRSFK